MSTSSPPPEPAGPRRFTSTWLRGAGVAAFMFFLIKGLLWLAVAFMAIEVSCG